MRHRIAPFLLLVLACSADAATDPEAAGPALDRVPAASNGGRGITVTLSGAEEVPARDTPATGTFHLTLNPGLDLLCYELTASGLLGSVTGAHIHRAPAGANGGVLVPLIAPADGSSGECRSIDDALLWEIWRTPEAFYVNVHSTVFPGGEIRAQLGD